MVVAVEKWPVKAGMSQACTHLITKRPKQPILLNLISQATVLASCHEEDPSHIDGDEAEFLDSTVTDFIYRDTQDKVKSRHFGPATRRVSDNSYGLAR